jgi:broad specificity phosphatase PhoE
VQLILIRHGRPERIDHDPNGANPGLTDLGRRQAAAMATYLSPEAIDALYVSPQQRAIDTAAPLAGVLGHTPTVVHGLAEFDLGHSSYIPGEEAPPLTGAELDALIAAVTADSFRSRVHDAVDQIISAHPGETVAAVCHGGVISTVLADLLGVDVMTYLDSQYTSVSRIKASKSGRKSMASFNECHWLREL